MQSDNDWNIFRVPKKNSLHVILNYISNIKTYKYEMNADTAY